MSTVLLSPTNLPESTYIPSLSLSLLIVCSIFSQGFRRLRSRFVVEESIDNNDSERGNQRERDRERAQARTGGKAKQGKGDGLTPEQRRERDAKALQEKAAKKAAQEAGGNNAGGGGGSKK